MCSSRSLGLRCTANKVTGQCCLMLCKAISQLLIEVGLNDSLLCDVNASRPIVLLTDVHHTTARQSIAGSHL